MPRRTRHTPKPHTSGDWLSEELGPFHPSWLFIGFFVALMAAGMVALSLPMSASGTGKPAFLDILFTAVSAASGSGLTVVDTISTWSRTGQQIILGLFVLGGLGSLVGSTMLLLIIARKVSDEDRFLLRDFTGTQSARGMVLLIAGIVVYALAIQAIGAYLLGARFSASMPASQAWWMGIFHAASAFNNAGFDILGMSANVPPASAQLLLAGLSLLGSFSFIVVLDLARGLFFRPLSLDTKLVLAGSAILLAIGITAILLTEYYNPATLGPLSLRDKVLAAFSHATWARTAGLATANVGAFAYPTLLLLLALMFIGGSAGSTTGGVKVNSFAILIAAISSFVRGNKHVTAFGTQIHEEQVYRALAMLFVSGMLVFGTTVALSAIEGSNLFALLFEAVSAFSTTGFSMGITPDLSPAGKLLISFAMFAGRVGPVTLIFALSLHRPSQHLYTEEAVNLG